MQEIEEDKKALNQGEITSRNPKHRYNREC